MVKLLDKWSLTEEEPVGYTEDLTCGIIDSEDRAWQGKWQESEHCNSNTNTGVELGSLLRLGFSVCVCVCVYIYMCVCDMCVHACMYAWLHVCVRMR